MLKRYLLVLALVALGAMLTFAAGCGSSGGNTAATDPPQGSDDGGDTSTTLPPSENPIRIVLNAEITGPLVYDTALVKKGVRTALEMIEYRLGEWSIDYQEVDNKSDPLLAVEQIRQLVETDTDNNKKKDREPIDFICGPLSSAGVAGVTYFLSQKTDDSEKIAQCSVTAQPKENMTTSGGVGFIPNGSYSSYGYFLGKFAAETLHFKTANCIHYIDRAAEEIQAGFERGFTAGGGAISSLTYVPSTTVEFTSYFAQMPDADCTMFWVRGSGAIPFVRQFTAANRRGQLLAGQSSNYSESQLEYLRALGVAPDIISCDVYSPMLDNALNDQFIAGYQRLYPGDYPTPEVFGGWQAVMLYAGAVNILTEQKAQGVMNTSDEVVDPRDPADVITTMSNLTIDTPAGPITMSDYSKTFVAVRDFYILRSRDVGGGRVAWMPLYTYPQVTMAQ